MADAQTFTHFIATSQFGNALEYVRNGVMKHSRPVIQGLLYLMTGQLNDAERFDEAALLYAEMIKNDAADYYPHHELAILHTKKKEYALAEVEYRRAVELEPKGPYTHMHQSTSLTPSSIKSLYFQFGRVLFHNLASAREFEEDVRTGKYSLSTPIIAELIAVLDKSIELNPDDCRRSVHQRAYVYFIAREYPTAIVSARKYLAVYGKDAEHAVEIEKARVMIEDCMRLMSA